MTLWTLFALVGCMSTPEMRFDATELFGEPVDVAIVPGAPSNPDGSLARWQARRVLWAWRLYHQRQVTRIIVSGSAAYNRYVEAEALAAGLTALGVPPEHILLEPQALHTDENANYAMRIAEQRGYDTVVVASEGLQANGMCAMIDEWSDLDCRFAPLDVAWAMPQLERVYEFRLADVRTQPVPEEIWLPIREREQRRELAHGYKRPSSLVLYTKSAITGDWTPYPPGDRDPARTYADFLREGWGEMRFDH